MAITQAALLESIPTGLFINGKWEKTAETFVVEDPATGEKLVDCSSAGPDDGRRALDAAVAAQEGWAKTAPRVRGEILRRAWEIVQDRREELSLLMTIEMGKPLNEASGEVTYGGEFLRWFAEEAVRINGRYGWNPEGTGHMLVSKHPVGPCLFITPWNFPFAMATRKVGPALAAGCTCVVKPARLTPLTTLLFAEILQQAGLPDGVVNVLPTAHTAAVTDPLIADPRLRKLSFTGSTPVGKQLIAAASENVLRVSMELGGNAPFLVFEDADLDKAVDAALAAKFRNGGEACTAANRFFVQESVAEEFTSRIAARVESMKVGHGTEPGVDVGPLIDAAAVDKCRELVDDAVSRGAKVLVGGREVSGPGHFFEPTVLADVPREAKIVAEEIFGPVLAISTFTTESEAVERANATEYGLASYVMTESVDRVHRMVDALDYGLMGVNVGVMSNAAAPFGGVKQSGMGREGSFEGIEEYLSVKYTLIPG